MQKSTNRLYSVLFITFCLTGTLWSQSSLQLSAGNGVPAGSVSLNLSLNSPAGQEPASIEWSLNYPPSNVTGLSITAGSSAISAGKSLTCAAGTNSYICIADGINSNIIANGTLATVNVSLAPGAAAGTAAIGLANALGASVAAASVPVTTTAGSVNIGSLPSVSGLSCAATVLLPGNTTSCTVTLGMAAGVGGTTVQLSSNSTSITVPTSVTIAAGSTTGTFQAVAGSFSTDLTGTVSAATNGSSMSVTLTLTTSPGVQTLQCSPGALTAGHSATCTVTLSKAAPAGGATVTLANSAAAALTAPASVKVLASQTTVSFQVTAGGFSSSGSATITASLNGTSQPFVFGLTAPSSMSLSCASPNLTPGSAVTCTIGLGQAAPAGGATIKLTSSSGLVTVPPALIITHGDSTVLFAATGASLGVNQKVNQSVVITATWNSTSQTAVLNLSTPSSTSSSPSAPSSPSSPSTPSSPSSRLLALACTSPTIAPGGTDTCYAVLAAPAAASTIVTVSSSNAALSVPATVTLATNAFNVSFSVTASSRFSGAAVVTAALNGTGVSATLAAPGATQSSNVEATPLDGDSGTSPSAQPIALQCAPMGSSRNGRLMCEVRLNAPSVSDTARFRIVSSSRDLRVPPSSAVRKGQTTFRFEAEPDADATSGSAVISILSDTGEITATVGVSPARDQRADSGAAQLRNAMADNRGLSQVKSTGSQGEPALRRLENGAHASALAACSPGAVATLQGASLMNGRDAGSVLVNGEAATVVRASDDRLDFLCPRLPAGTALEIAVETPAGRSDAIHALMQEIAPGIFAAGSSEGEIAQAVREGSSELAAVASSRYAGSAALPGDTLLVRATGIDCSAADAAKRLHVRFGSAYALPSSVTPTEAAGQCEIAVVVPPGVAGDAVPLSLEVMRTDRSVAASNALSVAVEPQR